MNKEPMTQMGFENLQEELREIKTVKRPALSKALEEAREHGDLSENAEFLAAKELQGFIEGRAIEIQDLLRRAEIIDVSKLSGGEIMFGATIRLADEDTKEKVTYQIVGTAEADIQEGRLSITSPLARALIGRSKGESVEVSTPRGFKSYEIVSVRYK